jgi:hypothetical protein
MRTVTAERRGGRVIFQRAGLGCAALRHLEMMCVCVCVYVQVCSCVLSHTHRHTDTQTHTHTHTHTHIYILGTSSGRMRVLPDRHVWTHNREGVSMTHTHTDAYTLCTVTQSELPLSGVICASKILK